MAHSFSLPPLEALQAVLTAARLGSFSAAAEALDVTHGAISRRIASVEKWAGIILFRRHGRGVRLTLEGERLASRIELAVAMLEDGRSGGETAELDVVRVGIVQSFARLWLLPNIRILEGEPPDLRIEPEIDHRHMTLSDARIAIRLGQGDWPGVIAEPLFSESLQPVACREIADALGPSPSIERLLGFPIIHDANDQNWRLWFSSHRLSYERRAMDRTLPGHDLALLAASSGIGIALGRDPYGRSFRGSLDLVNVHPLSITNPQCFHIVLRPGHRHGAVERLIERFRSIATARSGRV